MVVPKLWKTVSSVNWLKLVKLSVERSYRDHMINSFEVDCKTEMFSFTQSTKQ